jgi:hypothetical protein
MCPTGEKGNKREFLGISWPELTRKLPFFSGYEILRVNIHNCLQPCATLDEAHLL